MNVVKKIEDIWVAIINYLSHFGWIALIAILLLGILYLIFPLYFHWILLFSIIIFFIYRPLFLIYILVGSRNSLRAFFVLFVVTQLIFSLLYLANIKGYDYESISNKHTEEDVSVCHINEQNSTLGISYKEILMNTFHVALIQEISPFFQELIDDPKTKKIADNIFIILNIQIFISWIYLGVLISSLYNKIVNR
jgi:hypothetical protein